MDFRTPDSGNNQVSSHPAASPAANVRKTKLSKGLMGMHFVHVVLLFALTILVASLAVYVASAGRSFAERKYVDSSRLQVVSLANGLVYIGRITALNNDYVRLADTFFITPSQAVQGSDKQAQVVNYDLVKPGCEIFGLEDEMVINREQLVFWENLKSDGKAAKAVEEYRKQNPDGQKCTEAAAGAHNTPAPANR
jgi:hypothetical protein